MNKKIILLILSIIILTPNLALAYWWNPMSWIKSIRHEKPKTTLPVNADSSTSTSSIAEIIVLKKEIEELKKEVRVNKQNVITPKKSAVSTVDYKATVPIAAPAKVETSDATKEYEIGQIIKYCNMPQFQKVCADKNVITLSIQGNSFFRTTMIKVFTDSVAKDQETLKTLKMNAYWSERAAEPSKQTVDQSSTKQDSFNREVCEKAGGTYFAEKCI